MNNYNGPILDLNKYNGLHYCIDNKPNNGILKVKYISIIDGDTAYFKVSDNQESIRFMVVDCPKYYPILEEFGEEAMLFSKSYLENAKEIYIESDINNTLKDDTLNHRLLAWIWVDGQLLNYLLVLNGLGDIKYLYNDKMKYYDYMIKANDYAKMNNLGIYKKINT